MTTGVSCLDKACSTSSSVIPYGGSVYYVSIVCWPDERGVRFTVSNGIFEVFRLPPLRPFPRTSSSSPVPIWIVPKLLAHIGVTYLASVTNKWLIKCINFCIDVSEVPFIWKMSFWTLNILTHSCNSSTGTRNSSLFLASRNKACTLLGYLVLHSGSWSWRTHQNTSFLLCFCHSTHRRREHQECGCDPSVC